MSKTGEAWINSSERRAIDLAIAAGFAPAGIAISSAAAAAVAVVDRVNPLFVQRRIGKDLQTIRVPKLRTLPTTREHVPSPNGFDDPRASNLGRFLRKAYIDEFPQGMLILAGRMSVVGPRPLIPNEVEEILDELSPSEQSDWLRAKSVCRPGIIPPYNAKQLLSGDNYISPRDRVEMDVAYFEQASLSYDMDLIIDSTSSRALAALKGASFDVA